MAADRQPLHPAGAAERRPARSRVHRAGLTILRDVGVEVLSARALDLFEGAGASVERAAGRWPGRGAADGSVSTPTIARSSSSAPSSFELHARNPERNLPFGDRHLVFGAVGGPAFVTDIDRGRRPGQSRRLRGLRPGDRRARHRPPGGRRPLEPTDLPVETRHLDMYRALATTLDKTWQCLAFGAAVVDDAIEIACIAAASTATPLTPSRAS